MTPTQRDVYDALHTNGSARYRNIEFRFREVNGENSLFVHKEDGEIHSFHPTEDEEAIKKYVPAGSTPESDTPDTEGDQDELHPEFIIGVMVTIENILMLFDRIEAAALLLAESGISKKQAENHQDRSGVEEEKMREVIRKAYAHQRPA